MLLTVNERFREAIFSKKEEQPVIQTPVIESAIPEPQAYSNGGTVFSTMGPVPIFTRSFNGEKNPGELGNPTYLLMDHQALRARAYEANGTSDVVKIITGKFKMWVVGNGLKFQAEPKEDILKLEGVTEDIEAFKSNVEPYFELWANSPRSDYAGENNLHINAANHEETKFLGGDDLVICRIDDNFNLTVQVIDGQHIIQPGLDGRFIQEAAIRGNSIIRGVEIDSRGRHVAYYVRRQIINIASANKFLAMETERISAYEETTGMRLAWMGVGLKHRIDHVRGIPAIYSILEKVAKLDRYTEATVATAEERAKIVYTIVHGKSSDGRNPLIEGPRRMVGTSSAPDTVAEGATIAQNISVTEEKQVYNLPIDSELKAVSSQSEIQYEPFFKAIFIQLCAAVDIPPEVALQQYNSNYSASRAAINGWGFIIDIYRKKLSKDFYQPIYNIWLYLHVLKGKVQADKYLKAKVKKNVDIIEAYSAAKFTGISMPHIDPVKEMTAIRLAMGTGGLATPLISNEQATEQAQYGDWETNVKKLSQEMELPELVNILKANEPDDAASGKDQE